MSHGKEDEEPEGGKKNEQEEDELEGKEVDLEELSNKNGDGEIARRHSDEEDDDESDDGNGEGVGDSGEEGRPHWKSAKDELSLIHI